MTPRQARSVLGLPRDGDLDDDQITAAYRKTARRTHPDTGGSADAFKKCLTAAELLRRLPKDRLSRSRSMADGQHRRFTATDFNFNSSDYMDSIRESMLKAREAAFRSQAAARAEAAAESMFDPDFFRAQFAAVRWARGPSIENVPAGASVYILDGNLCCRLNGVTLTVTPDGSGSLTAGDT